MLKITKLRPEAGALVTAESPASLDSLDARILSETLRERGALLLRGFSGDPETFNRFTALFGHRFVAHGAPHRKPIDETSFVHDADPGMHTIHLHTELGYFPIFPDTLWFHCLTPPAAAGETTICDGVALWNALSAECRNALTAQRLRYSAFWTPEVWQRYFQVADEAALLQKLSGLADVEYSVRRGRLSLEYRVPAVRKTVHGGVDAFANSLLHYALDGMREFVHFEGGTAVPGELIEAIAKTAETLTYAVQWQAGDVLMIDNSRVLHGRNSHADPARKLHVKLGRIAALI